MRERVAGPNRRLLLGVSTSASPAPAACLGCAACPHPGGLRLDVGVGQGLAVGGPRTDWSRPLALIVAAAWSSSPKACGPRNEARGRDNRRVSIFLARPARPAHGIPLAVKDLFDTAGLVTTYGSIVFAEHVPERTAEAVARLEVAGYAIVGKTNLHEFAYGISSQNPHFGTVPNPIAPGRLALTTLLVS